MAMTLIHVIFGMLTVVQGIRAAEPITPSQLLEAFGQSPSSESARELADRIRSAYPEGTDLTLGRHDVLIERNLVAFVLKIDGLPDSTPRVVGMINHNRGVAMKPIGQTGLWAWVEEIETDTKFAYTYEIAHRTIARKTVEMPDWSYPPESKTQVEREYGRYEPLAFRSEIFGNDRTGWYYIPAVYDPESNDPAALMVFQDGDAYKGEHVGTVVDNLITEGAMPLTVLVLLNPGVNDDGSRNRGVEYDTLSDRYARFLEQEVLPRAAARFRLRDDPSARGICGASSGGICAFTVAWERPDLFGRVVSHIGSFVNIRGGHVYPELVRQTDRKPIRIVMSDGTNDLINRFGDWWEANNAMYRALQEEGYRVDFLRDHGFHAYWSAGVRLPETLRLAWKDYEAE